MSEPTAAPEGQADETVFLAETLPDGTRREWLMPGQRYAGTAEHRARILRAIEAMQWQRPEGQMAMSPGLLLQGVIAQMGLKLVGQVGHAPTEPIEYPDCNCPHPPCYDRDHYGTYSLIGIKCRRRNHWWTLYLLDVGTGAALLIMDVTDAPMPHGGNISGACALEWHDKCTGTYRRGDGRAPCQCACPHDHATAAADGAAAQPRPGSGG